MSRFIEFPEPERDRYGIEYRSRPRLKPLGCGVALAVIVALFVGILAMFQLTTTEPGKIAVIRNGGWLDSKSIREVRAAWFRRRNGVIVATLGHLRHVVTEVPADVHAMLEQARDGRYGGAWIARWDGHDYVSENPQPPEESARHLAILRPMLENYPAVPDGHAGWYRYPTDAENRRDRTLTKGGSR